MNAFLLSAQGNVVFHFDETASTVENEDGIASIQYPYAAIFPWYRRAASGLRVTS